MNLMTHLTFSQLTLLTRKSGMSSEKYGKILLLNMAFCVSVKIGTIPYNGATMLINTEVYA